MNISEIQIGANKSSLDLAKRQEEQLTYFTQSKIQESILTPEQIKIWSEKNYQTNDYFLNYIKSIFLTENFQFFVKYLRFPLPSAQLIKNKIEPQLNRVFVSDNSYFKYKGAKEDICDELDIDEFETELFNRYLYKHNSIIVTDVKDSKPIRYFVNIKDVKSITHDKKEITSIYFTGNLDGLAVTIYIDNNRYAVFSDGDQSIVDNPHDLGYCPAFFIAPQLEDDYVVRRSLFTYVRADLENYVFLSTLVNMTNANGVIPIVSQLDVRVENHSSTNQNPFPGRPNTDVVMGSQAFVDYANNNPSTSETNGLLQPGSVNKIPVMRKVDGSVDMEAVKNYIIFHYLPIENLKYIQERVKEYELNIVTTIIGDGGETNVQAKNTLQITKSLIPLENTLISMADDFNEVREASDKSMLDLAYGVDAIEPEIFYGTSFFLQTETELMERFKLAPNPLERRNILAQVNRNKFKNNHELKERSEILYKLIPFVSDADYLNATTKGIADIPTSILYLQFDKWINRFESEYGDIVQFAEIISENESESINTINNILLTLIKKENGTDSKNNPGSGIEGSKPV